MELPKDFLDRMKKLIPEEYDVFLTSYQEERSYGLRINTYKITAEEFERESPFGPLKKIPWCKGGYYYDQSMAPGKHPWQEAGLYYIQEPSAMLVGELAQAAPFERILDLCAAPGGKTTHLASKMMGKGILVSNEIHPSRVKILSKNVERMGIPGVVVVNESPATLSKYFPSYFDKVIVDAPCSGEGMFRKEETARKEWSLANVEQCAARQQIILNYADRMLKPGGKLIYSTCTFSPEENEGVISRFLEEHSHYQIQKVRRTEGMDHGNPDFVFCKNAALFETVRIWPHHVKGEGHFAAVLCKTEGEIPKKLKLVNAAAEKGAVRIYEQFVSDNEFHIEKGTYIMYGDQLYSIPDEMVCMEGLKVVRPGLHLGTLKKNRFEPSHALAMSLSKEQVYKTIDFDRENPHIISWLKGESFQADAKDGWNLILVDGYPIGWGKVSGGMVKNHYPKGLRWN